MRRKKVLLILGVLALLAVVYLVLLYRYEVNYFTVNRVGPRSSYDDVIARFGEPNDITWLDRDIRRFGNNDIASIQYDGTIFIVAACRQTSRMYSVQEVIIYDPVIRFGFGWRRVGIGSTMQEVERAHRNERAFIMWELHDNWIHVEDGLCTLRFYFDEDDQVYRMVLGRSEFGRRWRGRTAWWDRLWE